MKVRQDRPLYPIGVVSELLDVHPETIRTWERSGVVRPPQRRSGKRFYSENNFKQLQFIQRLTTEGLTLRAMLYYLRLYPCWKTETCYGCIHNKSEADSGAKPCWQEVDTYCEVAGGVDPCVDCHMAGNHRKPTQGRDEAESLTPSEQPAKSEITSRLEAH